MGIGEKVPCGTISVLASTPFADLRQTGRRTMICRSQGVFFLPCQQYKLRCDIRYNIMERHTKSCFSHQEGGIHGTF
jgi:hypothetical protein